MAETETAITRIQPAPVVRQLDFTADQRQMIRDTYANGASDEEFAVLMEIAKVRSLNPLLRQVFFVQRWDNQKRREVWAVQVSIDGIRAIAERTGRYEGQTAPMWCDKDGVWRDVWLEDYPPAAAKVGVYRQGFREAVFAVARWTSYVATKKDGHPTSMWMKLPDVMLAKCAEALALRKAFPEDTSGLYTDDEMGQAERPALQESEESTLSKQLRLSVAQAEEKKRLKPAAANIKKAAEILDGEIVEETLAEARQAGESDYLMPFASKDGHWEKGDPIASLSDEHIKGLLRWKGAREDLKGACAAELLRRNGGEE